MDILIVGAGFSGTLTAVQVIRAMKSMHGNPVRIYLIEKTGKFGQGLAYSTSEHSHLLNVPVERMSAIPSDPDHLINWYRQVCDPAVQPGDFIPRMRYGQYLQSLLSEAQESAPAVLERVSGEVVEVVSQVGRKLEVRLKSGEVLVGDQLVLAMGNCQPTQLSFFNEKVQASPHYYPGPWCKERIRAIDPSATVAIVGSGLSMVDAAVMLKKQGHQGKIFAFSRHGLMPQVHRGFEKYPPFSLSGSGVATERIPQSYSVRQLIQRVRSEIRTAQAQGKDWRGVLDSLRPQTQMIWRGLALPEKLRFLRHLQAYWDIHRHRMAPEIGKIIQSLQENGQLKLIAARIQKVEAKSHGAKSHGMEIQYRPRGEVKLENVTVNELINCGGMSSDFRKSSDPFILSLLNQQLVRLDSLNLGMKSMAENIHILGPLLKGTLWETIAVPELRVQAEEVARKMVS